MYTSKSLETLDKAAEIMNHIISFERQIAMINENIKSNPLFDGLIPKWKSNLQFTKKRLELFRYEYNNLITELY